MSMIFLPIFLSSVFDILKSYHASSRGLEPRFMASKAIVLPLDELELERVTRIELAQPTWKDGALPLCNTRIVHQVGLEPTTISS